MRPRVSWLLPLAFGDGPFNGLLHVVFGRRVVAKLSDSLRKKNLNDSRQKEDERALHSRLEPLREGASAVTASAAASAVMSPERA